jgi:hypothetical protein
MSTLVNMKLGIFSIFIIFSPKKEKDEFEIDRLPPESKNAGLELGPVMFEICIFSKET